MIRTVTHSDGRAVTFAQLQAALRDLQQQGDAPVISESEYLGFRAPALSAVIGPACQLKITLTPQRDVQDIMDKATGTFGFYNESLASVEAGDCFDNAMVDIFLGNQTPEEAFQTVQDFYEENVWE